MFATVNFQGDAKRTLRASRGRLAFHYDLSIAKRGVGFLAFNAITSRHLFEQGIDWRKLYGSGLYTRLPGYQRRWGEVEASSVGGTVTQICHAGYSWGLAD